MQLLWSDCVIPKFVCWNPTPQQAMVLGGGPLGRDHGQMRLWDRVLTNGIGALRRVAGGLPALYPGADPNERKAAHKLGRGLSVFRHQTCWHLDLGLLVPRTMRKKHLLFKPLSLWCSVTAARTKRVTKRDLIMTENRHVTSLAWLTIKSCGELVDVFPMKGKMPHS